MSLLQNTEQQYSLAAKALHWVTALGVVLLFALGWWMVGLDYYHEWYQNAPNLHMGGGVVLALLTVLRLVYRCLYPYPRPIPATKRALVLAATVVHIGLYLVLLTLFVTGYLIVTAEGDPVPVFGLFEIPALVGAGDNMQDRVGDIHEWVAYSLMALAGLHGGAALWHHFKLRDNTLLRMISKAREH